MRTPSPLPCRGSTAHPPSSLPVPTPAHPESLLAPPRFRVWALRFRVQDLENFEGERIAVSVASLPTQIKECETGDWWPSGGLGTSAPAGRRGRAGGTSPTRRMEGRGGGLVEVSAPSGRSRRSDSDPATITSASSLPDGKASAVQESMPLSPSMENTIGPSARPQVPNIEHLQNRRSIGGGGRGRFRKATTEIRSGRAASSDRQPSPAAVSNAGQPRPQSWGRILAAIFLKIDFVPSTFGAKSIYGLLFKSQILGWLNHKIKRTVVLSLKRF